MTLSDLNIFDTLLVLLVGVNVLTGFWRGFLVQIISLASLIAAFIVSRIFASQTAAYLESQMDLAGAEALLAYTILFTGTLFVGGLLAQLARLLAKTLALAWADRAAGAALGAFKALLLALVIMTVGEKILPPKSPALTSSITLPYLRLATQTLLIAIPAEVWERLPNTLATITAPTAPPMPETPAGPTPTPTPETSPSPEE